MLLQRTFGTRWQEFGVQRSRRETFELVRTIVDEDIEALGRTCGGGRSICDIYLDAARKSAYRYSQASDSVDDETQFDEPDAANSDTVVGIETGGLGQLDRLPLQI